MTLTSAAALTIPPVEDFLARTASSAHPLVISTYDKLKTDPSVGKTRSEAMTILACGATSVREKERRGDLKTWVDGTNVRISTVSLYLHILDLIVMSHPVDGPKRKARVPTASYQKGHRSIHREEADGPSAA
jgi:hypothetical protein